VLRVEILEFAFFIAFCLVCWLVTTAVDALHIGNAVAYGTTMLLAFGVAIAALEWCKHRAMGKAKSRYVATVIFWDTLIVPALLWAYYLKYKVELPLVLAFALYAGVGTLILAVVGALALARPPGRRARATSEAES
jgi:hypothetical protein